MTSETGSQVDPPANNAMRRIEVDFHQDCSVGGVERKWTVGLPETREHDDPPVVGEIVELWDAETPMRCRAVTTLVRPAAHCDHGEPPCPYMEFAVDPTSWHEFVGTARCAHASIGPVSRASCIVCGEMDVA